MGLILFLVAVGMFAGTVDAIAGGGGLISLPVLLSIGVPPHVALGTNKLQGAIGTFVAARRYYRHGWINLSAIYKGVIYCIIGSILGAFTTQILSTDILRKIIPFLLFCILLYTLFSPRLGHQEIKPRLEESRFYLFFGLLMGFYDGFFGPCTGSFWVFLLVCFLGHHLIKATAYTKVLNFNSSFVAAICFALGGNIDYRFGFAMAAGQLIGARLGAHLAMTKGAYLIRPLFLFMVSCSILTLAYRAYAGSEMVIYITEQYGMMPKIMLVILFVGGISTIFIKANKKQKEAANKLEQGA